MKEDEKMVERARRARPGMRPGREEGPDHMGLIGMM